MPKQIIEAEILEAAIEVVLEKGYASATTKQIAERASISEMTLFRRFGSKANLVIAAVRYLVESDQVQAEYTGDVERDLLHVLKQYSEKGLQRQQRLLPLVLVEISRYPELQEAMSSPFQQVSGLASLLARYQAEGHLKADSPLQMAAALLGPLVLWSMLSDAWPESFLQSFDLAGHIASFLYGRGGG